MQKNITIHSKEITLLKPLTSADYDGKTVLTDSAWEYVELWLMRQTDSNSRKALFFWRQAKHFFLASECLPQNSKPLTSYYCCLNATKALLCVNGIDVTDIHHGVSQPRSSQNKSFPLDNAELTFEGGGALNTLCRCLGENVNKTTYCVKDLLYNIPCIHRAFSITYPGSPELFIPIDKMYYVREDTTSKAWIQFSVDPRYANGTALRFLPNGYEKTTIDNTEYCVRKKKRFKWDIHGQKADRLQKLSAYHQQVRQDIYYICGSPTQWYIKKNLPNNPHIIRRSSLTLIFAVMHWMSELVRYNPQLFEKYMQTRQNWLLHEFIEIALHQFVDEISCEITHQEIMSTAYRK